MLQYTLLFDTRVNGLTFFITNIIELFSYTLGGVVLSCARISPHAERKADQRIETLLSGIKLRDRHKARELQAKKEKRRELLQDETVYRFVFNILLDPQKVKLVYKYLKDQPNLLRLHLFRS